MPVLLLSLLACTEGTPPAAAVAPATATPPAAALAPAPAPASPPGTATTTAPASATPDTPSLPQLSPKGADEAYDPSTFETLHGGYGGLPSPSASSTLPAQGGSSYGVSNLDDDSPFTAWVEGVEGDGVGESIAFTWGCGDPHWTSSGQLSVLNGYQKSAKAFRDNGRVRLLELSVDGTPRALLNLEDRTGEQVFDVPVSMGDAVRLTIRAVYPGAKYPDTALSEVWIACGP